MFFSRVVDGKCTFGWVITGKWSEITSKMYCVFEFVVHYLFHSVALIYFYGKVIMTSRKALHEQSDTTSSATQKVINISSEQASLVTNRKYSQNSPIVSTKSNLYFIFGPHICWTFSIPRLEMELCFWL